MKKILSAALAVLMILTFAACDGEDNATTEAKKTDAPTVTTTSAPETTTKNPETTTNTPDTTTAAPDVTTNAPAATTGDTSPETIDPEVVLLSASKKANDYQSFVMTTTSKTILEINGEKTESVESSVLTFKKLLEYDGAFKAMMVTTYEGEEDSEAVEGKFYYEGGILYSDFADMKLYYEIESDDFLELAGLQVDPIDYTELFSTLTATERDDCSTVVSATDFTEKGKEYIASIIGDLSEWGDVNITYPEFSVDVILDKSGDLSAVSMRLTVEVTVEGETVRMTLHSDSVYSNINNIASIDFPSFDDFELLEDME